MTTRQGPASSANPFDSQGFIAAIKNTLQQLKTRLNNKTTSPLPCYLIIGDSKSGKSSLLDYAEVSIKQTMSQEHDYCKTWLTDQAIYIELSANILENHTHSIWPPLLKQFNKQQPLSGIILTINLFDACQQTQLEQSLQIEQWQATCRALTKKLRISLPLYLIYTHCDQIRGFSEYFSEMTANERQQACGFFMSTSNRDSEQAVAQLKQQFTQLCQQLNERLTRHLQQQRQGFNRRLIYEFTLQFESLTNIITPISQVLLDHQPRLQLSGLFFTSNLHQGATCDRLAAAMEHHLQLASTPHSPQQTLNKAFFTHQLIADLLPQQSRATPNNKRLHGWRRKVSLISLALACISGVWWIETQFQHHLTQVKQLNMALHDAKPWLQATNTEDMDIPQHLFEILNTLSTAQQRSLWQLLPEKINPFVQWQTLQRQSLASYHILLNKFLLPKITQTVTAVLEHSADVPHEKLYNALKVYLMLAYSEHRDTDFIMAWFSGFLKNHSRLPTDKQQQLLQFITNTLQQNHQQITADEPLIKRTRALLNKQPPTVLAYALLKATWQHHNPLHLDQNPVFSYAPLNADIPYLYSKAGFINIYQNQIKNILQVVERGNWVLGTNSLKNNTPIEDQVQAIKALYVADYINWWNLFIYNTKVLGFRTLEQAQQAFANLAQSQSALDKTIHVIQNNTSPLANNNTLSDIFNTNIANAFTQINSIKPATLNQVQSILKNTVQQLKGFQQQDKFAQAYAIAKQRFSHQQAVDPLGQLLTSAQSLPAPMQTWLQQLANNYWHMVLNKTQHYINQQWQTQVLPEYQQFIARHYPVATHSPQMASLEHFTKFFAPAGTLNKFVTTYLDPFINKQPIHWQVKKLNGLGLSLDQSFINQLIRARLIRKMFFNNKNQLAVDFTLQPQSFEPIIKDVILSINGQSIFTYQGSSKTSHFTWPGKAKSEQVTLTIDTINKKQNQVKEHGPWAWFKLLEKANMKTQQDTRHYQLLFALNGSAAKFNLVAKNNINPFIPNVINQFELPAKL